jgi:Carboxypeptidase regulatory-like domain
VKATQQTGVVANTTTNGCGYYLIQNLPAGIYDISVTRQGFKASSIQGVNLGVASQVRKDVTFE